MLPYIHPMDAIEEFDLTEYKYDAPEGEWIGRLDTRAWGKSQNLLLYFTDINTAEKYRLSVFSRNSYKPYKSDLSFRKEQLGKSYKISTSKSKNGLPKFLTAELIQ